MCGTLTAMYPEDVKRIMDDLPLSPDRETVIEGLLQEIEELKHANVGLSRRIIEQQEMIQRLREGDR